MTNETMKDDERAAFSPEECNQDVFKLGQSIGLFDIPKDTANEICKGISGATGAHVDWHYIGGRVHIKALPARGAARATSQGASNDQ